MSRAKGVALYLVKRSSERIQYDQSKPNISNEQHYPFIITVDTKEIATGDKAFLMKNRQGISNAIFFHVNNEWIKMRDPEQSRLLMQR